MKTFLLSLLLATLPLAPETLGAQEAEKSAAPPTKNDWSRSKLTKLRGEKRTDKKRHGGAAYSRLAEKGLDWLVKHQQEDGSWSSHRLPAACANSNRKAVCDEFSHSGHVKGPEADVGLTGLALLAFAGRGNTYLEAEDAKYKTAIDRAVKWLTEVQISDEKAKAEYRGFIGREKDRKQAEDTSMYGHAIATLALCELLLGTGDKERLAAPTQAAVDWCLRAQNPGFGWHYGYSDGKSATPSTIWLSTAVLLGEECVKAGLIDLKRERFATSRTGTLSWLDAVTSSRYGITGYQAPGDPGSSLHLYIEDNPFSKLLSCNTAGTLCYRALEKSCEMFVKEGGSNSEESKKEEPAAEIDPLERLLDHPPKWQKAAGKKKSTINFYFWALASQAIALRDGKEWISWRKTLERQLSKNQESSGCAKGSWDPIGEWGVTGGRVYSTSMAILALESSYRYQVEGAPEK